MFKKKKRSDYFRYKSEIKPFGELTDIEYEKAVKVSTQELSFVNPLNLGLLLNFSVFKFEILKRPDLAIEIARNTIEKFELLEKNEQIYSKHFKDVSLIIQLFRDNLRLWENQN